MKQFSDQTNTTMFFKCINNMDLKMKDHDSWPQCPYIVYYSGFKLLRTLPDLIVAAICWEEMFHQSLQVQFWGKEKLCGFDSIINCRPCPTTLLFSLYPDFLLVLFRPDTFCCIPYKLVVFFSTRINTVRPHLYLETSATSGLDLDNTK